MVPIGVKQKPLLEYVVRLFKFHGIKDLVFLVDYKSEQIVNYFEDGARFGVKISYVEDNPNSKGTGGAVLTAYENKSVSDEETLLVYYGDILTNMDLTELVKFHTNKKAWSTVALSLGFKVRVGLANLNHDSKVIGFEEKPTLDKPVSVGISVLNGNMLSIMKKLKGSSYQLDFMGEVLPFLLKEGKPVYGYLSKAFWYDVLSTEALEKLDPKLVENTFRKFF
jgi:mannose-1-phosphate guanylyltransferase